MTHTPAGGRRRRLGEILMEAGLLSEMQLKAALLEQRKWGGKLGRTLVEMGFLDEQSMMLALSRQLNLPAVDLDKLTLPPNVTHLLRVDMAERYGVFPIGEDKRHKALQVAMSDPTNVEALSELSFHLGVGVQPSVCGAASIERAIRRHYYGENTSVPEMPDHNVFESSQHVQFEQNSGLHSAPTKAGLGIEQLQAEVKRLEDLLTGERRALRALLELLVQRGVIDRNEYLAKVRGKAEQK